jgi:GTP-binding protein EngB required for normal cell division
MNKLSTLLVAAVFALSGASALAADPPKADSMVAKAAAALKKPAEVTQEAWDKMSDADKKKAVEMAAKASPAGTATSGTATAVKKEKKGGC